MSKENVVKMPTKKEMFNKAIKTDIVNSIKADRKRLKTAKCAIDLRNIICTVLMTDDPNKAYKYLHDAVKSGEAAMDIVEEAFKGITYDKFRKMEQIDAGELATTTSPEIIDQLIKETFIGVYNNKIVQGQKQLSECR